jgi:L-ascorbate oxidase
MKQKKRFSSGETTPRSSFNVNYNKRYRFRVLNTGVQYCPLEFSIDEHNLTVISTDGNPIQPVNVKSFFIMPGERVDFVLNASQNSNKNYWIKVKGHADCEESEMFQTAILKYNNLLNNLPETTINYENSGHDSEGYVKNMLLL